MLAVILLVASCSDDDDGGSGGTSGSRFACTDDGGNGCTEYVGPPDPISAMREQCTSQNGVVSETCSRSGVSGSCKLASGQGSITQLWYAFDADELNTVRQICQSGMGVWTDGA